MIQRRDVPDGVARSVAHGAPHGIPDAAAHGVAHGTATVRGGGISVVFRSDQKHRSLAGWRLYIKEVRQCTLRPGSS